MAADPRDAALAEAVTAVVRRLVTVEQLDAREAAGQMAVLLDAVIRYRAAIAPDAGLLRAVTTGGRNAV